MTERTRAEYEKTPDSWEALRISLRTRWGTQLLLSLLLLFPAAVVAVDANDNMSDIRATLVAAVAAADTSALLDAVATADTSAAWRFAV